MNIKTVIFDFDGTLADSYPIFENHIQEAIVKFDLKVEADLIKQTKELGLAKLVKRLNIPFWKTLQIFSWFRNEQMKDVAQLETFSGIEDALKYLLNANCNIYLLSGNNKFDFKSYLESKNIANYFKSIYVDKSLWGKSHVINNLLKKEQLQKSETIYIGDEDTDVQACMKSGISIISVDWGYCSKKLLLQSNPNTVSSIKELIQMLKSLM